MKLLMILLCKGTYAPVPPLSKGRRECPRNALFSVVPVQHPRQSQQAASRVRRVMSTFALQSDSRQGPSLLENFGRTNFV